MPSLRLSQQQVQEIVKQAQLGSPQEICGVIAGANGVAQRIFAVPNQSASPETHFNMDATALLQAYKTIDVAGQEVLAVYHSHPTSDPLPSQRDIRESMYNLPNVIHLIVSLGHTYPRLQAWRLHNTRIEKVELLVGDLSGRSEPSLSRAQIIAVMLVAFVAVVLLLMISFSLLPPAPPIPTPQ